MTTDRQPMWVVCNHCNHEWIALYMPMPMREAARLLGRLHCPMCAANSMAILAKWERKADEAKGHPRQ